MDDKIKIIENDVLLQRKSCKGACVILDGKFSSCIGWCNFDENEVKEKWAKVRQMYEKKGVDLPFLKGVDPESLALELKSNKSSNSPEKKTPNRRTRG